MRVFLKRRGGNWKTQTANTLSDSSGSCDSDCDSQGPSDSDASSVDQKPISRKRQRPNASLDSATNSVLDATTRDTCTAPTSIATGALPAVSASAAASGIESSNNNAGIPPSCQKLPALKKPASNMVLGRPRSSDWYLQSNSVQDDSLSSSPEDDAPPPFLLENEPASSQEAKKLPAHVSSSNNNSNNKKPSTSLLLLPEETEFAMLLKKHRGLEIQPQDGDGNCLFRAVSLQVYGDPSMHAQVRAQCLDYMERDREHFSQFVTGEPFDQYIARKRQDGVHANNPELQAISELFNRPIEVFSPESGLKPLNIFHAEYKTQDAPIRLSYHDGNHYNAVVDPLVPTAGLGLGLPGLQPGLADKMQVAKAVAASDAQADEQELERALTQSQDDELQRAIKESQLSSEHLQSSKVMALSDMDATYFELEQAALERSLQSFTKSEHGKKQRAATQTSGGARSSSPRLEPSVEVTSNSVASLPSNSSAAFASAAASVPPVEEEANSAPILAMDEYPPVVQELTMNGFELAKVVRAVELVGSNFDDLLAFLMSNTG
eukprot:Nitzschia sp. Nitz4//scaffold44_size153857//76945//78900//NITZ4_002726-RA/size153857-augustus-gene-0.8-mRNA-1//1//CDS//3329552172//911//frame0